MFKLIKRKQVLDMEEGQNINGVLLIIMNFKFKEIT